MKYTFENLRKISQNEYERHTVDHIENITTDDDMEGKTTVEKQEHLCGTLGLYGTQSQINLGGMVLEELRELEQQNKRYREAIEKAEQWLKKMNDRIESHERPDWWSDQTERLREFYGRADGMETILEVIHKALEGEE